MHVWYASYGSNILEERFMCYINGTKAPGSAVAETGCTDRTPPLASKKAELPYSLYFAKERSKWGEGGVAFIDDGKTTAEITIGKMYLITKQQFAEVVAQENNSPPVPIDLEQVIRNGSGIVGEGWYSKIIYAGDDNGYPIFTFTNPTPAEKVPIQQPNINYLSTIAKGITQLGYSKEGTVDYFLHKRGIAGSFTKETLHSLLFP